MQLNPLVQEWVALARQDLESARYLNPYPHQLEEDQVLQSLKLAAEASDFLSSKLTGEGEFIDGKD
jgi:hypothetical protein